ncbi:MAG: hypothetical protein LAT68_01480 [Cyclobacteriaceae bacterium]|nr:hypothetical protein [Cyclobacteriaceae bacterium]MCH8514974.1 hypothetical protein [Cyclobacteriaceae bacterium]
MVICNTFSYFLEKGFREVDLRLYKRVDCFDFEAVEQLLQQGGQSAVDFYGDNDSNVIARNYTALSYYLSTRYIPDLEIFERKGYDRKFNIRFMFEGILGLAANVEMYFLLKKYGQAW